MVSFLVTFFIQAPLTITHASDLTAEALDVQVNKFRTITLTYP